MNNRKQRLILLIISILTLTIGLSFAYYSAVVQGTGNTNAETSVNTATIGEVEFNGTSTFDSSTLDDIYPGYIGIQTFTISPYKNGSGIYEIDLAATVPEAFGNDIKLTLYKTSDKTNNNISREEGTLTINNNKYSKQDTLIINGTLTKVYEKVLNTTDLKILEQVEFAIDNNDFTTPIATPDGYYTYYAVYEYLDNGNQNSQQGLNFNSKITVKYVTEINNLANETLGYLATLNSNYVLSNSDKCLKVDENGMIINPTSIMSDEETPIICAMEDDYGTSYYLRGNHQDNNVKFANMCWKLIRITGTGGYKLIYNGDLDANGKCTTTSGNHTGFTGQTLPLSGNKVYGTSYTKEGSTYTLTDTSTMNWTNDSASIIGKYTCVDTNTSCSTLYVVTGEYSSSQGYALKLDQSTNYAQIGTSTFNYYNSSLNSTESASPALVGYMYNNTYPNKSKSLSSNTNNYFYGESFTYNNGSYTLNNTVQFADVSDSTNKTSLNTHHYTCFNATDTTCTEMYYIHSLEGTTPYYIKLNGNETGPDALNKMVTNNDINVKNSAIKGAIDWWYEQNIKGTEYESELEDTVFCNDRTIYNIGGWSETGNVSNVYTRFLDFNAYKNKYYLKCPNKRDAFTVDDSDKGNSALTYPIGILTIAEHSLTGSSTANKTGEYYWASAPRYFDNYGANERYVASDGFWYGSGDDVNLTGGARPSISLKPGTEFKAGTDGTAANPFVVE